MEVNENNPFLDTSFLSLTKNPNDPDFFYPISDFSEETHPTFFTQVDGQITGRGGGGGAYKREFSVSKVIAMKVSIMWRTFVFIMSPFSRHLFIAYYLPANLAFY